MNIKITALLPMKANSERVIGKNFRLLAGQPLFMWMLKTLQSVDVIDKIVINTDARSIINKFDLKDMTKVIIKDRPKEICGDLVSMNKIIENYMILEEVGSGQYGKVFKGKILNNNN